MKDALTFYRCDTKVLEEKILVKDMIEGTELAGHLERWGKNLGTLYFDIPMGPLFEALEELYEVPFQFLMGQGERRLQPSGPVTYCGRQIPSEMGEFAMTLRKFQRLLRTRNPSEKEQKLLEKWEKWKHKVQLEKAESFALERLARFLEQFKDMMPELISAYERW